MSQYTKSIGSWLNKVIDCECGQRHDIALNQVVIEAGAQNKIAAYLKERGFRHAAVVGDGATLEIAGRRLAENLQKAGIGAAVIRIDENEDGEVIANEQAIVQLLCDLPPETEILVANGSGTIHDIVRFVSHRTNRPFISVPTAPSVDGFVSSGAPLILRGFKRTIPASSPEAVFADLDILQTAPRKLIAAGFGDLLGKYTSLADWQLGRILLDEHYCPLAAKITAQGLELCVNHVEEIAKATPHGMGLLMEGLILSGISMLMMGHSRPASGSEHHLSHFWEMRWILERRKAELHGAKVGVACILMARLYRKLRDLPVADAAEQLRRYEPPKQEEEMERIREAFGPIWQEVAKENFPAKSSGPVASSPLDAEMVIGRWDQIVEVARSVPEPEELASWLKRVGGAVSPEELGVSSELVNQSLSAAFYVRNRYTILRLARPFGWNSEISI